MRQCDKILKQDVCGYLYGVHARANNELKSTDFVALTVLYVLE